MRGRAKGTAFALIVMVCTLAVVFAVLLGGLLVYDFTAERLTYWTVPEHLGKGMSAQYHALMEELPEGAVAAEQILYDGNRPEFTPVMSTLTLPYAGAVLVEEDDDGNSVWEVSLDAAEVTHLGSVRIWDTGRYTLSSCELTMEGDAQVVSMEPVEAGSVSDERIRFPGGGKGCTARVTVAGLEPGEAVRFRWSYNRWAGGEASEVLTLSPVYSPA